MLRPTGRLGASLAAIVAFAAFACLASCPAPARAQTPPAPQAPAAAPAPPKPRPGPLALALPPDAKRDYDAGKLLFEDGDFATALLKYRDAYDRTRDPRLLWNLAVCQKNLRHYAKAGALLRRYVAEGGALLSAGDRRDAQDLSRAIAPFSVAMVFRVNLDGAEVSIDDEVVGGSPLPGPVVLDMGARRVRVRKEGHRVWDREVPVGGSAPTTVDVTLERQSGHLELHVPAGAHVTVDDRDAGTGPTVAQDLSIGAHAVRVTAAHMRTLQTDVLVEDAKSRTMEIALEPEAPPTAEVHVAVSCLGPDPLPQEALAVFFDDSTESALPMGVRIRREEGREVVAYVPYRVAPGRHVVHVSSTRCEGSDVDVDVSDGGVADVRGELRPHNGWVNGSPAGSPDGWRVSAGLVVTPSSFTNYQNLFSNPPAAFGTVGVIRAGPSVTAGLQGRWWLALLEGRFEYAKVNGSTSGASSSNGTGTKENIPINFGSTFTQWSAGIRVGGRVPLVIAALSAGVGLHLGQFFFSPDSQGTGQSGLAGGASTWVAIDLQPVCDWGLQLGGAVLTEGYATSGSTPGESGATSFWLHGTYTPNSLCQRGKAGLFKIESTSR
jgi:hypothetical protein